MNNKPTKVKPTKQPRDYTPEEWKRLLEIMEQFAEVVHNYDLGMFYEARGGDFIAEAQRGVYWPQPPDEEKHLECKESRAVNDRHNAPIEAALGKLSFEAFAKKDAQFFDNLALWIKRQRGDKKQTKTVKTVRLPNIGKETHEVRTLKPLTYAMLGEKRRRGRGGSSTHRSLEVVFKTAVLELIGIRQAFNFRRRISRTELMERMQGNRRADDAEIKEPKLTNFISKHGIAKFLA